MSPAASNEEQQPEKTEKTGMSLLKERRFKLSRCESSIYAMTRPDRLSLLYLNAGRVIVVGASCLIRVPQSLA